MRIKGIRFITALAAVAALAALSGCGGGGGGGGGGGVVGPSNGSSPSTSLHTMAVGDEWDYTVTGTATAPGQTSSTVTGTVVRKIIAASQDGASMAIQETSSYSFSGGGLAGAAGGGVTDTYFLQDASGNVYETGQDSTPDGGVMSSESVNSPSAANDTIIPGVWAAGQTTNANITYSDNTTLTQAFTIGSSAVVTVPYSTLSVWNTSVSTNGSSSSQTWDPKMGSYVTNTYTETANLNGTTWTITTTAKLTKTSVTP